jgi:uncharacterized protein (TIGR00251 family)
MLDIREADGGVTLGVRVQPRAARDEVVGERAGALVVRLTAPPAEGQANAALVRLLARKVGRPPSAFRLVRGAGSRDKVLRVEGLTAAALRSSLELPAEGRR